MEANATVKVNGERVEIIGSDTVIGMYQVRHSDGQVGWGRMEAIQADSDVKHSEAWYHALSVKLSHRGYVTLADIRKAETSNGK